MKRLTTISLAGSIVLIAISTANAAYIITFDEFPLGALISNQYAGLGVIFHEGDLTPRLPQISMNGAMPTQRRSMVSCATAMRLVLMVMSI